MLDELNSTSDLTDSGSFADNYGDPWGLPSARAFAAELTGVPADQVIVNGSSSLNLMHDIISHAVTHGLAGQPSWAEQMMAAKAQGTTLKFLCPAPGYDRHFAITQHYGFENVAVPMTEDGPNMDVVKELVENDSSVKGIWCVPRFANPTGITYQMRLSVRLQTSNLQPLTLESSGITPMQFTPLYQNLRLLSS